MFVQISSEYMALLFSEKYKVMYIDTDSFIYHIECNDVYEIMKRDINRFDMSDYAIMCTVFGQ